MGIFDELAEELGAQNGTPGSGEYEYRLPWRSLRSICNDLPADPDWLVQGLLAPAATILLSGAPKVGKSTLMFRLLRALETGEPVFGLDARVASWCLLSEENPHTLAEKRFDFEIEGDGEVVMFQDADGLTLPEVVHDAVERCVRVGHGVLVIDTLSRWGGLAGDTENHAGAVTEAWKPLAEAQQAQLCTVVIHHTRKGGGSHGEAIRGSNQILALADISVELHRTNGEDPHARVLRAQSRYRDTPQELGLIYHASEYEVVSDVRSLRREAPGEQAIIETLTESGPATAAELVTRLDGKYSEATVRRWLPKLVLAGKLSRSGAGTGAGGGYLYTIAA